MRSLLFDLKTRFQSTQILLATFLVGFSVAFAAGTLLGQESRNPSPKGEPSGEFSEQVLELRRENLGADDYARRQMATRELWSERATAREEVERAARDADPEVAARARWILDRWQKGLLPDTPPEVLRRLAGLEGAERLEGLLDAGLFSAVTIAIEQAAGAVDGPSVRKEVSESIERRFPFYLRTAVESNQVDAFCNLLEVATESPALAVARAELLTQLGFDLQQRGWLPASADRWTPNEQIRAKVLVLATLGDVGAALDVAREAKQMDMVRACDLLQGNWSGLIEESKEAASNATPGSLVADRNWVDVLVAAHRAPLPDLATTAMEKLLADGNPSKDILATDLRWRALLIHGYVEAGLQILQQANPVEAAEVLGFLARYRDAFSLLGIDPDDPERGIERLFEEAHRELWGTAADDGKNDAGPVPKSIANSDMNPSALTRLVAVATLQFQCGETVRAEQMFRRIAELDPPQADKKQARYQAVIALWNFSHQELAIQLSGGQSGAAIDSLILYDLIHRMSNRDGARARAIALVWEAYSKLEPSRPASERLLIIHQLFQGIEPNASSQNSLPEQLYDLLTGHREINGRIIRGGTRISAALGDFFMQLGYKEQAQQIYQTLAHNEDSEAEMRLAEIELKTGSAKDALARYRRIWHRHSRAGAEHRVNTAESELILALKALMGEIIATERMGNLAEAEQQRRMLRWMLAGTSFAVRTDIAEQLAEHGETELAKETLEHLTRYTAFGASEGLEFAQVAPAYAKLIQEEDPALAARWSDLATAGTLESAVYYSRAYLIIPARYQSLWAIAAAKNQDTPAVKKHLQQALKMYPLNITLAEDVLAVLREEGMESEANAALDQILEQGQKHLDAFPGDSQRANNLAWVAALADYRLPQALELSRRACYLEPDSVTYRDTLAEILFRMGRKEEALAIERACLLDEPNMWHLHEQIARFEEE